MHKYDGSKCIEHVNCLPYQFKCDDAAGCPCTGKPSPIPKKSNMKWYNKKHDCIDAAL